MIFIVASPLYLRNFRTYGNALGLTQSYTTHDPWSSAYFSNLMRNVGLHLGTPFPGVNRLTDRLVGGIHDLIGSDKNSPDLTFSGTSYETVCSLSLS